MGFELGKVVDSAGEGLKHLAGDAQKITKSIDDKYVSKVTPKLGKFGDAAKFVGEMIPGVSEIDAVKDGDWKGLAVSTALDAGSLVAGAFTAGTGLAAVKGAAATAKAATKVTLKEVVKTGGEKAVKAVAETASKKAVKEVAVTTSKKAVGEGTEAVAQKSVSDLAENVGGDTVKSFEKVLNNTPSFEIEKMLEKKGHEFEKIASDKFESMKLKNLPAGGNWEGEKGNSHWVPNLEEIPKKSNPGQLTFKKILEKSKKKDIEYKDGQPDFSGVSKFTTKIENFTTNRSDNFAQADKSWAKELGITPREAQTRRGDLKLVWHESSELGIMELVPRELHNNIPHAGGISKLKIMVDVVNEGGK